MLLKISDKQMVLFLTAVVPLLILFAALIVAPNIWVIMLAILWMGVGLMMLYLPKAEG